MEAKFCVRCGCKLYKTSYDRWYCPNDGIFEENNREEEDTTDNPTYIGVLI